MGHITGDSSSISALSSLYVLGFNRHFKMLRRKRKGKRIISCLSLFYLCGNGREETWGINLFLLWNSFFFSFPLPPSINREASEGECWAEQRNDTPFIQVLLSDEIDSSVINLSSSFNSNKSLIKYSKHCWTFSLLCIIYAACLLFFSLKQLAILHLVSQPEKTTCHCRMISAVCYLCPPDPCHVMHTHTLPLRGDVQSWPQGKKHHSCWDPFDCNVSVQFCPAGWLTRKRAWEFLFRTNVRILVSDNWCKPDTAPLISMLIFATDVSDSSFFPWKLCHMKIKESQLQPLCLSRCCWTRPCLKYKKPHRAWRQIAMVSSTLTNDYGNDEKGKGRLSLLLHQLLQQPSTLLLLCSLLPCSLGTLPQQGSRHPHRKHNCDNPARPWPPQGTLACVKCFSVSCPDRTITKICLILFISSCLCSPEPHRVAHRQGRKRRAVNAFLCPSAWSDSNFSSYDFTLSKAMFMCLCAGLEVGNEQWAVWDTKPSCKHARKWGI